MSYYIDLHPHVIFPCVPNNDQLLAIKTIIFDTTAGKRYSADDTIRIFYNRRHWSNNW